MTLLVEKGTFTKTTTTTGLPFTQTVNLSNGSLTPKLLILWTTGQTTNDGTYNDDSRISYGFSDGTNDACQAYVMDESGETESYSFNDNCIISINSLTAGVVESKADVSSFNAGNFILNWTTQSDANARVIHYIVAGGTDITNVSVVNTTVGSTGTGDLSYNGSGTTFTPDFALMMTGADSYTTANSLTYGSDDALFCIGAAKSTSKRWVMWGRDETVGTADCDMYLNSSACLASCSNTTGAITFLADFVSFNSAAGGGITVNVSDGADATTKKLAFLFVKGATWDCGAFQQRSGTGTQDVTILTDLNPEIVFLGGINTDADATVTPNFYVGIGASDGTNEGASYIGNTNAAGTFTAVMSNLNTKVYRISTPNATAASSTTNAECDMTGMTTPGQFTLDWTTADTTLRRMVYWTLGTIAAGTLFERSPATETVTVSESISRLYAAIRPPATETTSSSETLARLQTLLRPIDTETTTLSESIERTFGQNRSIDTETVTVADTTARMLAANRTLQEDTISAESLTRLLAANRSIDTETVAIADQVTRIRGAVATIAAETVTISDTVSRMLAANRSLEDTTTISDSVSRLLAANRALETETISITDQVARLVAATRTIDTETTSVSDSITRVKGAVRTIEIETTVVSDAIARLLEANRAILETISITDSVAGLQQGPGQQNLERSISETIIISESLERMLAATRTIVAETTTINDDLQRQLNASRTIDIETTSIIDSVSRVYGAVRAIVIETTAVTDQIVRSIGRVRTLTENVTSSDSVTRLLESIRQMSEQVSLVDSLTRQLAANRIIDTETTSITDSLIRLLTRVRTIVEDIDISESITRAFVGARPILETVDITDTVAILKTAFSIPTRLRNIRQWLIAKYSEDDPSL